MRPHLAAGFVLALLAAGCLILWIGVPLGALWLASQLTTSPGAHLAITLLLVISGMVVTAAGLAWINDLYLRITGGDVPPRGGGVSIRRRGPLEPMLFACFIVALAALVYWFFVLAENPTVNIY